MFTYIIYDVSHGYVILYLSWGCQTPCPPEYKFENCDKMKISLHS